MSQSSYQHEYLDAFKELESLLKRCANVSSDATQFKDVVDKAKSKNSAVKHYESLIWDLYGLRNVFAHADRDKYIAEVNDVAYEKINELIEILQDPPKAGEVFKADVYYATTRDITEEVLKRMMDNEAKHIYTHVPVYEGSGFIGVLSETTVLRWLIENVKEGEAQFYKKTVSDINRKYLNSPDNKHHFVSHDKSVFEIKEMFDKAIQKGERLGVVLITNTGNKNEQLLGIVTAWDLPKIDEYLATQH